MINKVLEGRSDAAFIRSAYSQSHRKYHTLGHLNEMLRWVPDNYEGRPALIDAILYHDYVHFPDPHPTGELEAMSILHYGTLRGLPVKPAVAAAIIATAFHHVDQVNLLPLSQMLCDLDMCTLAYSWDEFAEIQTRVFDEYAPVYGSIKAAFRENSRFMEALRARKQIYYMHPHWEEKARANIEYRLTKWRCPSG